MASEGRRVAASVIEGLEREPAQFGFFQAVRLLEWASARARDRNTGRDPVGGDGHPAQETVRFRASVSLEHPATEVGRVTRPGGGAPPEMTINFMGLIGPLGVLPEHYTEQLIEVTRLKNTAYRDFLDMLSHRSIALFYRAWSRNRPTVAYERRQFGDESQRPGVEREDLFGKVLASLVGLGTPGLEGELPFGRDLALHHSGQISNRRRSARTVQSVTSALLERPVEIRQFQGEWLPMEPDARTRLPSAMAPMGQHATLGTDAILGVRAWDVQANFTIRVGPLSLEEFRDLMPDGTMLKKLVELVRFTVGPAQNFSVQPVLRGDCVPPCRLGGEADAGPVARLGWDSWLGARGTREEGGDPEPRDDAVFSTLQAAAPGAGAPAAYA